MKYSLAAAALAATSYAAPLEARQAAPTDAQILNYALTLEHLENAFYQAGLKNFTSQDFCNAGAEENFYANLKEISKDEMSHVAFLSGALGAGAVQPSTYDFGVTDAASFLAVANVLEGVGVSAYLGAARYIMNKDYLTAAASILTVESRHSAYIRLNQNPAQSPFPYAYDTPLDFDEVYSLAAQFITSMPAGNADKLPALKAFPALTVTAPAGVVKPGDKLTVKSAKAVDAKAAYFINSQGNAKADLTGSGADYTVTVPTGMPPTAGAQPGQGYLVLTSDTAAPTDDNIVAGPAVVQIADNEYGLPAEHKGGYGGWNGGSWDGKQGHW
ncbi:Hypothetical predicted protein [Lecanosticta acicola]|uniref:Ferritin-like domain-containing protein n=1 Tax=Lecanosticta acicola TaxID=111012 RepID=A0AAI9E773_9PEZI|nr:Hypothetical predicted protein [Lecanosticta acicola]